MAENEQLPAEEPIPGGDGSGAGKQGAGADFEQQLIAAEEAEYSDEGPPPRRPLRWLIRAVLWMVLAAVLASAAFLSWLDSESGHRFVTQQIAAWHPASGFRVTVGRIDGSLYHKAVLRDVRLADPRGRFMHIPLARLSWWPLAGFSKRLEIDDLAIPDAHFERMPHFNQIPSTGKILPDFDIRIMSLSLDRLRVEKAVTGREQVFAIAGDADVRHGRAVVDLSARAVGADDRLLLALDSRPDDRRFDVDLTVNAPAGGLLATLAGVKKDSNLRLEGKGDWTKWDGRLLATLDHKSAAGFTLAMRSGHVGFEGTVMGTALASLGATQGLVARLADPSLAVKGDGTLENRLLSGTLSVRSRSIAVKADGGVHLGGHGFDNLLIDVGVARPQALLKSFDARDLVARMRLNGPFATARFEYLLRATRLRFGRTVISGVHAAGEGHVNRKSGTMAIPVDLTARRIEGQGALADSILRDIRLTGTVRKQGALLVSTPLTLRSAKLDGALTARVDLKSGRYAVGFDGDLRRLLVPGLGVVDLNARIKATPDAHNRVRVDGRARAQMRRLDIGFLRTLGGGLPVVDSDIALGSDGQLLLRNIAVRAPLLTLRGEGVRNADGTVRLSGTGQHSQYGPFELSLTGDIARPTVDVLLARPLDAAGLAAVHARLEPDPVGYRVTTQGQSTLGPFAGEGMLELPHGGQNVLEVDRLTLNGSEGAGRLLIVEGGLEGRLLFSGGVSGTVDLAVPSGVQTIVASLRLREASFAGAMPLSVRRGRVEATIRLDPGATAVDARIQGGGVQVGTFRINRLDVQTQLVNGAGPLKARLSGQRGRLFDLDVDANISADAFDIGLKGSLDRQPLTLDRRARISRIEGGWALDPVAVRYRGGGARVLSAALGAETRLDVELQRLPLSLLDISNTDLGLGGVASGRLSYTHQRGTMPTGQAQLVVRGLTRSGVTRTSTAFDLGVNARLTADRLAMRAIAAQGGKVIGKAQALMTPLGSGRLMDRLRTAPVRAQMRYVGPAETLWRLSTVEIVDLRGDLAISANIGGTGANPVIDGALMTRDAVLESPITGMRLTELRSQARFNGSRLVFSQIHARSGKSGQVSGTGSLNFSLGKGVGIDMRLQADKAVMLERDDLGATVSGPVTIRSDGNGGVIGGTLDVVSSRFTMGRAAAVAQIPELQLIEKNSRGDDFASRPKEANWRLDFAAKARNRLMVDGMGLSSEWSMDLKVSGNVTEPRIVGRADLVRGTYDFAGRRFDLTQGALRFDGSVPANPTLDITASASITDLTATIRITGTSAAPEITFSSSPSLPEDEILSRILFGSAITQLSAPEALQLASAVGSLRGGGGLDPINAVRKAAGLDRLRIIAADPTKGQGTSIGVGKYLSRRIYVELITDGQGYSATQLEYQITRWLSLLSSVSTLGRQSVTARVSKNY